MVLENVILGVLMLSIASSVAVVLIILYYLRKQIKENVCSGEKILTVDPDKEEVPDEKG